MGCGIFAVLQRTPQGPSSFTNISGTFSSRLSPTYNAWLSAAIVHDRELCSDIDPLFVGAHYGLAQVCQNLLHEDPDRKTQPLAKNTYGRSALHAAAQMGHSDVSDVLLKHLDDDGKVN
jgi:ankyrin repeat protein